MRLAIPSVGAKLSICSRPATPEQCSNSEMTNMLSELPGDAIGLGLPGKFAPGITINDDGSLCFDIGIGIGLPGSMSDSQGPIFP